MRIFKVILSALLLNLGGFAAVQMQTGWFEDAQMAQKVAKERHQPLLIAFLGPNWCGFSDTFEKELLSKGALTDSLGDAVVLVKVDIPEDFAESCYCGRELKEKFQVEQCPCLVIADQNADLIAKLDSLPARPEQLAQYVRQILGDYERMSHLQKRELRRMKIDEVKHLYTRAGRLADAAFKKALMQQGLKIDRGSYFLLEEYEALLSTGFSSRRKINRIRKKVVARDPLNTEGSLRKLALIEFETGTKMKSPLEAISPLTRYLGEFGLDDLENAWKLEMKISQYLFGKNQIEEALKHAKLSYSAAPQDARGEIAQTIEYLKNTQSIGVLPGNNSEEVFGDLK